MDIGEAKQFIIQRSSVLEEKELGRIINPEGAGKQRANLSRSVLVAIQELMREQEINARTRDLAAYIVLALLEIESTIEGSVSAWEKRGYWIKADRFRMDWEWAGLLGQKLRNAIETDRWEAAATLAVQIAGKLTGIKTPKRGYKTEFWEGAWEKLKASH